jgi:phenylalanyl-tRNA synthetase alpha chain
LKEIGKIKGGILYKLTEEGKKYLEIGLPEINLIKLLAKEGEKRIEEIELEGKPIAISWAKKNGWIAVKDGMLILTGLGREALEKEYPIEKALRDIAEKGECEENLLNILLKRKLVEKAKEELTIKEIAQLTPEIILSKAWKTIPFKRYDVLAPCPRIYAAKKHPYMQFIDEVKEKLIAMGFEEVESPLCELEFWNFDALFSPQDHPAREWHDVFKLKVPQKGEVLDKELVERVKKTHEDGWIVGSKGWRYKWNPEKALRLVLRSHTTPASIRFLSNFSQEEAKVFCIGRIFRPDVIDKTHLIEFDQCEGIIVGKNVTFRHLLGMLKEFAREVLETDKVKFVPHYYPFTEPSVDMYVYFPKLRKWVEIVGSGMFRPEVLKPLGIDKPVLAWGFGFSRLAMVKLGIEDIRYLFAEDLDWLRNCKVI